MNYNWLLAPTQFVVANRWASELGISPLFAQCLLNRGLATTEQAAQFLNPQLNQLADPFLIPNMAAAVERLFAALKRQEPLVIFGDYDVDGVTSTALLIEVFRGMGLRADYYLPHRLDEGYGLSREGVENCLKRHPVKLLVAVDCGSTSVATIAWLRGRGVDVLVLDHHQVSTPPPQPVALVNPQLRGTGDPDFRELCSAGLAFKLAHALVKRGRELALQSASSFDVRTLLDLVALGTIADLVPLTGENRILAPTGLERIANTVRPGLQTLKTISKINREVGVYEVGFKLAPRLNAAGRLENAEAALQILLTPDQLQAEPLAQQLDAQNYERQQIEHAIAEEVIQSVRSKFNPQTDYVVVEGKLDWHIGVVGIVASRVLRAFHRPTIILGGDGSHWRGSGRSIEGFNLAAALRECGDLLIRHGGHAMAAGVTLDPDKLEAFRLRLNDLARNTLTPSQLQPSLRLDAETTLPDLTLARLEEFGQLQPTGMGNPCIQLLVRQVHHQRPPRRMGREQQHSKWWVTDGVSVLETICWNLGTEPTPKGSFDLAFEPSINEYNGSRSVQLKALDWQEQKRP